MTKQEAQKRGRELLHKMKDDGWELRVWENMGWHYSLQKGGMTLYEYHLIDGTLVYNTLFSRKSGSVAGEVFWAPDEFLSDPNEAVDYQIKLAKEYLEKFTFECSEAIRVFDKYYDI